MNCWIGPKLLGNIFTVRNNLLLKANFCNAHDRSYQGIAVHMGIPKLTHQHLLQSIMYSSFGVQKLSKLWNVALRNKRKHIKKIFYTTNRFAYLTRITWNIMHTMPKYKILFCMICYIKSLLQVYFVETCCFRKLIIICNKNNLYIYAFRIDTINWILQHVQLIRSSTYLFAIT